MIIINLVTTGWREILNTQKDLKKENICNNTKEEYNNNNKVVDA